MRFENSMPEPDEMLRGLLAESSLGTDAAEALRNRAALRDVREVLRRSAALGGADDAAEPGTVPERWQALAVELARRQRQLRPFLQDARARGGEHRAAADEVDRLLGLLGNQARAAAAGTAEVRESGGENPEPVAAHLPGPSVVPPLSSPDVDSPARLWAADGERRRQVDRAAADWSALGSALDVLRRRLRKRGVPAGLADEPGLVPGGDRDFTDVVRPLDRHTPRGRRRLAGDALTRAYVAAGTRLLMRRYLTVENPGTGADLPAWLAPAAVLRELRNGPPYLPRQGSEKSLRRRWSHHVQYAADVLGYLEWVGNLAPEPAEPPTRAALAESYERIFAARSADRDPLTGLADRAAFLAGSRTGHRDARAFLLIDVGGIGRLNGALGLGGGDAALRMAARRVAATAQDGEVVGRVADTAFAVLTGYRDGSTGNVQRRAAEFAAALAEPMEVAGVRLSIEPTIGCAAGDGVEPAELLRRAEVALRCAKLTGTTPGLYDERQDAGALERVSLHAEVRWTIVNGALDALLQPVVHLHTGAPQAIHASVRCNHPSKGWLGHEELAGIAVRGNLLRPYIRHLLDAALGAVAPRDGYRGDLPVTVDLPPGALADRELPADLAALLRRHGLPGHRLILPVAEPGGPDLATVEDVLHGLRALGVQLAVTSAAGDLPLSLVGRVPVDEIRLGPAFVAKVAETAAAATILRYLAEFGRAQGMRVVATGVLTAEQATLLARLGCTAARGGYFGPPLPAGQALAVLQRPRTAGWRPAADADGAVVDLRRHPRNRPAAV